MSTENELWYCMKMAFQILKNVNAEELIKEELKYIFGDDLVDYRTMSKVVGFLDIANERDEYIFVKVKNFSSHLNEVRKSKIIIMVLGSERGPEPVSESEVFRFCEAACANGKGDYDVGDMVFVRFGPFRGLNGIVHKVLETNKYLVFFRFYSFCCFRVFGGEELSWRASVRDQWKFPVRGMKSPVSLALMPKRSDLKCQE